MTRLKRVSPVVLEYSVLTVVSGTEVQGRRKSRMSVVVHGGPGEGGNLPKEARNASDQMWVCKDNASLSVEQLRRTVVARVEAEAMAAAVPKAA